MTDRKSTPNAERIRAWTIIACVAIVAFVVAGATWSDEKVADLGHILTTPPAEGSVLALVVVAVALVMRARHQPPPAALLLALCLAPVVSGCGATALETQATGVTVALRLVDAAQDAYSADLDSRMAGCTDDACITAARASGQPVEAALDTALVSVRAWGAAVAVAADVDAGGDVPAVVLSALARVLSLWDELEAALRAYGVAVPPEVGHAIAFLAALAGAT